MYLDIHNDVDNVEPKAYKALLESGEAKCDDFRAIVRERPDGTHEEERWHCVLYDLKADAVILTQALSTEDSACRLAAYHYQQAVWKKRSHGRIID